MEKRMQEILEQQGMPFDYTGDIQTLMEKDDHVLMNATFVFMFGRIIGIREERAKRRGTRALESFLFLTTRENRCGRFRRTARHGGC